MNTQPPHVLLVEDDPTTAHFFQAVLQPLPARVDWARSCSQARHYVQKTVHDLWLIDLHLPDGTALALLSHLRGLQRIRPTPALAHTAELNSQTQRALQQAGFVETLVKPFSARMLLSAVQRALQQTTITMHWDDTAALTALGGQRQHLHTLRQLFLAELPSMRDAVYHALEQADKAALHGHLHRLKASCGFVGAVQLEQALRQLQQNPKSKVTRQLFDEAINSLLH